MRHRHAAAFSNRLVSWAADDKARAGSRNSFATAAYAFAVAASLFPLTGASAGSTHVRRPPTPPWHGYGFLPGYEPPEVIAWERARLRRPTYWYGGPGFYRGRWNGGGFGPCWTSTPIGPHWNCG